MNVGELCNREVVIIREDEPLLDAARRMREYHVGDLVVVRDAEHGRRVPIGILTDRDIVVSVVAKDVDHLATLMVGDVMTGGVVTARDDEDVVEVLERMQTLGVRRLPVLDEDGSLQGILTYDDLVEFVSEELTRLARIVSRERKREQDLRV